MTIKNNDLWTLLALLANNHNTKLVVDRVTPLMQEELKDLKAMKKRTLEQDALIEGYDYSIRTCEKLAGISDAPIIEAIENVIGQWMGSTEPAISGKTSTYPFTERTTPGKATTKDHIADVVRTLLTLEPTDKMLPSSVAILMLLASCNKQLPATWTFPRYEELSEDNATVITHFSPGWAKGIGL